jgi:flagellar biosynthesis protein
VQKDTTGVMKNSAAQQTDKSKGDLAIALRYLQGEDNAPRIVASGRGYVAKKILEQAQEHGVPIQENPEVAHLLAGLEIGQEVPTELYQVVAEVLTFVYSLDSSRRRI